MGMQKGTSIIFLNDHMKVLLVLRDERDDIPFPGCWDVPGGHVEQNETPEECIRREILEEIGVDIGRPAFFRQYEMADRIEFTFWREADFDLANITLHEGQRLKWFAESEIVEMSVDVLAFGFREVLLDFYREKPFDKTKD